MKESPPTRITPGDAHWPHLLAERLGKTVPPQLSALGNLGLLALPKTALFCSARCPGNVILTAYDQAAKWRDAGRCVISGFHSPVERECLQILMRGSQPIIICPARSPALGYGMAKAPGQRTVVDPLLFQRERTPRYRRSPPPATTNSSPPSLTKSGSPTSRPAGTWQS